ncbi:MAG TPA: hypothetical protein VFD22_01780, partial [Gemmatimonadaceae bacterium]|nr:hypothetical protein [Gemmatimonadaceae bacterium]
MLDRIKLYVIGLVALSGATASWVFVGQPDTTWPEVRAGILFAFLSCISGLLAYKKAARSEAGSIAFLPMLAAVMVAPSWFSVLAIGVATTIVEIASRRVPLKATFNVAQAVLWVSAAVLAYRYLGGSPLLLDALKVNYPAFVATLFTFATLNSTAVAGAIAISERQPFVGVWWSRLRATFVYDLFALPFVYLFALCYVYWG